MTQDPHDPQPPPLPSPITEQQARELLEGRAKTVTDEHVERVVTAEKPVRQKVEREGILSRFLLEVTLLLGLVKDYAGGRYRKVPWFIVAAIVIALLYLIDPLDLVPDFIPGIGLIDDATVLAVCLKMVSADLAKYRVWREERPAAPPPAPEPPPLPKSHR